MGHELSVLERLGGKKPRFAELFTPSLLLVSLQHASYDFEPDLRLLRVPCDLFLNSAGLQQCVGCSTQRSEYAVHRESP